MDTIKLYFHSMAMLMKCQLEYRSSFIMQTLAQIVMEAGELMAVLLIIDRFDALNQWTGGNLLFFFGAMSVTFYLVECFARGVTNFSPVVRSGALDTMLLRPRGVLTQVMCYAVDPRRIGAVAIGAVSLMMGAAQSAITWTAIKVLAYLWATICGGALILGLFLIEATLSIHSVASIEVVNVLTYGGRSTCQYPVDIFPDMLKNLFLIIAPFGLTLHVPLAYILDKPLFGWPGWTVAALPPAGFLFFLLMYYLFRLSLHRYRSTGS